MGETSSVDEQFLFLHGDGGNDLGTPDALVLPSSIRTKSDIIAMTPQQFSTKITQQGENFAWPLLPRANTDAAHTKSLMKIVPCPPFLAYDAFDVQLDAAELYERVLAADTTDSAMYAHLKHFLLSCLSSHNINDKKPFVDHTLLMAPPSADARRWGLKKFKTCFPNLAPAQQQAAAQAPDYAAILAQLLPVHVTLLQQPQTTERAEATKEEGTLKLSQQELETTLIMCGKDPTASIAVLPGWFGQCGEKGCSEKYKLTIIRKWIMANFRYEDAEVPLSAPLLKIINQRDWLEKDGNVRRPSIINAVDGISPFLLTDFYEDEVARINDEEDTFDRATLISVDAVLRHKRN